MIQHHSSLYLYKVVLTKTTIQMTAKQQQVWQQSGNIGFGQPAIGIGKKTGIKRRYKNAPKAKLPMYKVGLQNCSKNIT